MDKMLTGFQPAFRRVLQQLARRRVGARQRLRWNSNQASTSGSAAPTTEAIGAQAGKTSAGTFGEGATAAGKKQSRFGRILSEMKKKPCVSTSHPSTSERTTPIHVPLPVSDVMNRGTHLTGFLILHELTAVVPLVPLYYFFQWTGLSASFLGGPMVGTLGQTVIPGFMPGIGGRKVEAVVTEWIDEIARTVARVGSRYGIMGFHKVQELRGKERKLVEEEGTQAIKKGLMVDTRDSIRSKVSETVSGVSIRNVMDGVAAYALVKAFLPVRLAISVAGTPWFASRVIGPVLASFRRTKAVA